MPNENGNNTTDNSQNKFPNQGNFSASQNNVGNNITSKLNNGYNNNKINNLNNAQNELAKKGVEQVANTALGPVGGQIAKTAMNSEVGKKALDAASKAGKNLTKSPASRVFSFLNKKSPEEDMEEGSEEVDSKENELIPKEIKSKITPTLAFTGIGCLGSLILLAVIISILLAPLFFVKNLITNIATGATTVWNNIVYFFRGCDSEQECLEKDKESFYDALLDTHKKYEEKYNISLNTELITATLTYADPFVVLGDLEDSNDESSGMTDFKKSRKKINDLAEHMKSKGKVCVDSLGIVLSEYKENDEFNECPPPNQLTYYDEVKKQWVDNIVKVEDKYYVDEDKYRKYLEETFIRKFYFKGEHNEEVDRQIPIVIKDIYDRVEMVRYLNSSDNSSTNFVANNTNVLIMDCTNTIELETVSLYEYLQGVLYIEGFATQRSEEFLKLQAIIAKNYLYAINGATPDSIPSTLRVRSCQMNQLYCSIKEGCHSLNDGQTDSENTIVSGPSSSGSYHRPPVSDVAVLEKIKRAVDATLTEFIVKDGKFVTTQYRSSCTNLVCDSTTNILDQKVANEMINSGKTYKDVVAHFYNGELTTVTFNASGYPLDIVNNRVTSAFGWRVHPVDKVCRTHSGIDIAAPGDANIYSIADGIVLTNVYNSSYGNYTVIGHGQSNNGTYEYYSLYAHQIRLSTKINIGDTVKTGQIIGNVGSTGTSTGNHLHFEIYSIENGNKIRKDPITYFKGVELTGQVGGALYDSKNSCQSCLNRFGAGNC